MCKARLDLRGAAENRVLEGLIVFLTERAEGARITVSSGDVGSKVASTGAHLVNAATYILRKASESVRSEAGTIKICWSYWRCNRSLGVVVLQRDIRIDYNQTSGINEIKYRRRQQVIE